MNRNNVFTGGVLILISIVLGAFGAHALKEILTPEQLASFEVGVRYQMFHGLAILVLGFNAEKLSFSLKGIVTMMLIGVIFFSGSIYLLSLKDIIGEGIKMVGPVTPIGGSLFIISWIWFLVKLMGTKKATTKSGS